MAEAKKLGEILKEAGLIDDFQLQSALSHQRNWGGKLGTILIEMEFVKEEELARVVAEKLKTPYISLFEPGISDAVYNLIKVDVAKKYHVMPVKKEGGDLYLAMSDPLDIEAIDAIRFVTGLKIKPTLALESEIRDAIKKYYEGEELDRKKGQTPFYRPEHSTGKMEIIRGSDLNMQNVSVSDQSSPILAKDDAVQQEAAEYKTRLDALIALMIEKEFFTREELVSMIYQKKIGL